MKNNQYPKNKLHYNPFQDYDVNILCQKLKENNISFARQIVCLDEIFLSDTELNTQYLQEYLNISKIFNKNNIKIILDFHQDIFSRRLGGCGLPIKYFPEELKNTIIELSDPKLWGSTPLKSKQQMQCWKHFYNNCIQMYIQDICQVIKWLKDNINGEFSSVYYAIDIINEPGLPNIYKAKFLMKNNQQYKDKLSFLYSQVIQELNKIVDKQTYFIIEPFNYDVSQTVYYYIGMSKILGLQQELNNRIIFGPHVYQPVITSRKRHILHNYFKTMKKLQLQNIQINEFGDLSFNNDLQILEKQIRLFIQLDLPICIWELDITYQNQEQAWNNEQMSVLQLYQINNTLDLFETQPGSIYFSYTRQFKYFIIKGQKQNIQCSLSEYQCQRLQYCFLVSQQQIINFRLHCLKNNKFCKVIKTSYNDLQNILTENIQDKLRLDYFKDNKILFLCFSSEQYSQNSMYLKFNSKEQIIEFY